MVSVTACKNPFFKNMLDKNSGNASSVPEKPQPPNPQEPAVPENPANPEVPESQLPKYTVTFGVDGANGTLKATVDGSEINSGNKVEKSKPKLTVLKSIQVIKWRKTKHLFLPQSRMQAMR